jgi:hypothetical protein
VGFERLERLERLEGLEGLVGFERLEGFEGFEKDEGHLRVANTSHQKYRQRPTGMMMGRRGVKTMEIGVAIDMAIRLSLLLFK